MVWDFQNQKHSMSEIIWDQSLSWYSWANSNGLTHSFGSSPRVNSLLRFEKIEHKHWDRWVYSYYTYNLHTVYSQNWNIWDSMKEIFMVPEVNLLWLAVVVLVMWSLKPVMQANNLLGKFSIVGLGWDNTRPRPCQGSANCGLSKSVTTKTINWFDFFCR